MEKKSSQPYTNNINIKIPGDNSGRVGYAYSWWTKNISSGKTKMNIFWAKGWGGQKIIVIPEKNALVVFTGGEYNSGTNQFSLFEDYIFASYEIKTQPTMYIDLPPMRTLLKASILLILGIAASDRTAIPTNDEQDQPCYPQEPSPQ